MESNFGEYVSNSAQDYLRSKLTSFDNSNPEQPRARFEGKWVDLEKYQANVTIQLRKMRLVRFWDRYAPGEWREQLIASAHLMIGDSPVLLYKDQNKETKAISDKDQYTVSYAVYDKVSLGTYERYEDIRSYHGKQPDVPTNPNFIGFPSILFTSKGEAAKFIDKEFKPFLWSYPESTSSLEEDIEKGMRYCWPPIIFSDPSGEMNFGDEPGFQENAINFPSIAYQSIKQNLATTKDGFRLEITAEMELWGIDVLHDLTYFEYNTAALSMIPIDGEITGFLKSVELQYDYDD